MLVDEKYFKGEKLIHFHRKFTNPSRLGFPLEKKDFQSDYNSHKMPVIKMSSGFSAQKNRTSLRLAY